MTTAGAAFMEFLARAEKAPRYECLNCLDIGFTSNTFDSAERCAANCEAARLLWAVDVAEDRDLYARPA